MRSLVLCPFEEIEIDTFYFIFANDFLSDNISNSSFVIKVSIYIYEKNAGFLRCYFCKKIPAQV